jgi:hypothetical protein
MLFLESLLRKLLLFCSNFLFWTNYHAFLTLALSLPLTLHPSLRTLPTKNLFQLFSAVCTLIDKRIILAHLVDLYQYVEGMHAMIVISGQARAADLPINADLEVVAQRIDEFE